MMSSKNVGTMSAKEYLEAYDSQYKTMQNQELLMNAARESKGEDSPQYRAQKAEYERQQEECEAMEDEVKEMLSSLTAGRGKTALILHYLYGKTYSKIAEDMGITQRHLMRLVRESLEELDD